MFHHEALYSFAGIAFFFDPFPADTVLHGLFQAASISALCTSKKHRNRAKKLTEAELQALDITAL